MPADLRACPRCKGSYRPEARFCDGCGTPPALSCAGCSAELRPQARFCEGAGAGSEVEAALAQAVAWLDEPGAEALRARVLDARSALAAGLGDDPARPRDLAEALRLYRAMGADGHAARLAAS